MMNDNLDQLCKSLRLGRIPEILPRELDHAQTHELGYGEFLARLLRSEYMYRQERSMAARIKRARLPVLWTLETFPFKQQPGVKQAIIRDLAALDFIPHAANLVFIGPTGVGKTGLASALMLKALENGHRGLFIKAQELFDEMYTSLADHSSRAMFNRLRAIDVLLIDEMGYLNLRPEQSNLFFKLMDERYQRKPTIITTNLDYDQWYEFLGQKSMVEALLDRLRHHCHTIRIDGPSLRHPTG